MSRSVFGLFSENDEGTAFRLFRDLERIITAASVSEVLPALREVESAVDDGLHAAGFITYEAAPGLDSALVTCDPGDQPLLCFGLFRGSRVIDLHEMEAVTKGGVTGRPRQEIEWEPAMSQAAYTRSIDTIKDHLSLGDTYQVNFTFKMSTVCDAIFRDRIFNKLNRTRAKYFSIFQKNRHDYISVSPELFFELNGDRLRSRPMKGTARRGLTIDQDEEYALTLRNSDKDRAENLMILDMIRNDMGKIAEPGTVEVPALFQVETHPTVLQMTSTVECRTVAGFSDIVTALFPCASVTGAPKVRTMQIINRLEGRPRGLYTGTMGYLLPNRRARFNVAIRTVEIDRDAEFAEYGVGSGVVWDSVADDEYRECLLKAEVLTAQNPDFELLETMLWNADTGFFLLDGHLRRLSRSAAYFGFPLRIDDLRRHLQRLEVSMSDMAHRVRVLLSRTGEWNVEAHPLAAESRDEPLVVGLAQRPVLSTDVFLHHKTTHRRVYEEAKRGQPFDDVVLFNQRGEITESTFANIVIKRNNDLVTPSLKSGLLNGVFRQALVDSGDVKEDILFVKDIGQGDKLFLINSVRKWIPAILNRDGTLNRPR